MARHQPEILVSSKPNHAGMTTQILPARAIFAIFYNGQPIAIRVDRGMTTGTDDDPPRPRTARYLRVAFSACGHAFALCDRLNKMMNSDSFAVYAMGKGLKVTRADMYL